MTSPYAWYQYFVNVADADVGRYLRMFTFLPPEEIEQLEKDVAERPHLRAGQRRLAEELTTLVHGAAPDGAGRSRRAAPCSGAATCASSTAPRSTPRWRRCRRAPCGSADRPTIVDLLDRPPGWPTAAGPPGGRWRRAART